MRVGVGVVANDVPTACLEVQHGVEKVLLHRLGHEEMHAAVVVRVIIVERGMCVSKCVDVCLSVCLIAHSPSVDKSGDRSIDRWYEVEWSSTDVAMTCCRRWLVRGRRRRRRARPCR